ncbi:sensor histidine kinase [Microbispora sp. ATCC PTA-5024]|uniref:sensor histidine kinase n=1 Tax=Microbispora sp. ATCC PTA-5024 TaxID=316330 RepID=UPI0003DBFDB3|nr:sensor histidine kinase [Microbispora sp. ATCC PTA-5024]ETK32575.1 histidine kinase [Microbispora sp. ATCC PTA-5024]
MNTVTTMTGRVGRWSVARQMLALQVAVVVVTVAGGTLLGFLHARGLLDEEARRTSVAVAVSVARSPAVLDALDDPDPSVALQPYADRVWREAGLDFITIMSREGIRYTHPNPAQIGGRFLGTIAPALAGRTFTETYTGTLGPSVRAVTPVWDASGRVRALVSAGIIVERIGAQVREQIVQAILTGLLGLVVGTAGAYLVGARLGRQTHNLGAAELGRMYDYHSAILHAVREGLLLVDRDGRLTLANDGARELLGLPPDVEGRQVADLGLPDSLTEMLASGEDRSDEIHLTGDRVLVASSAAVRSRSRPLGSVVTLRDHTELQALTGQLDAERGFAESLRSAAHEAANRLHTVVALVELGRPEQAVAFATAELKAAQQLTDRVVGAVREPVLAALLLGKTAEAAERGVELSLSPDSELDDVALDGRDLVTILGNVIDNAVEAAMSGPPPGRVRVRLRAADGTFLIRVSDSGPGLSPETAGDVFRRGWTTKGDGRGLGLAMAGQAARRLGGEIEAGRGDGPGEGAVFTVRLPLPARDGDHASPAGEEAR